MPASERDAQTQPRGHSARPSASATSSGCSMSDLLASCAAASAVSTPPAAPEHPAAARTDERRRDAA
ncbi:hypothetical protein G3H79_14340 [Streptomyces aureoverticillatus]|nr:hypothetical protein [Streptomyces aureoverticillatus]QIB44084.1 hypothetical protein G3H79_14340 [Streptomyces aureoverticillatus]